MANCKYFLISGYQNFYFLIFNEEHGRLSDCVFILWQRVSGECDSSSEPSKNEAEDTSETLKKPLNKGNFFPTILTLCFYLFSILELCSVTCFFPNCHCILSLVSVFQISANIFL